MKIEELKVLVVDDNGNMRRLINTILRSVGIRNLMEAGSGPEALTILSTWVPDLVLVDYVMDGMTGVDFTKSVRTNFDKNGKRLPIIVITGYSELWRLNEAKKAGANDFIVKPFTTKALIQRITRTITYNMTLEEMEQAARDKRKAEEASA